MLKAFFDRKVDLMNLAATFFAVMVSIGVFSGGAMALTFDPIQNLSSNPGPSGFFSHIAVSGSNLFVVWDDLTLGPGEVIAP